MCLVVHVRRNISIVIVHCIMSPGHLSFGIDDPSDNQSDRGVVFNIVIIKFNENV